MTPSQIAALDLPAIAVRVARIAGSAPRGPGTVMAVTATRTLGTIGGGALEHLAIRTARGMLADGDAQPREMSVPLGPELGQCCGGRVWLHMAPVTREALAAELARTARPTVLILGAGHVGRALARALEPLPMAPLLIDQRADQLALYSGSVPTLLTPLPEHAIRSAPPDAAHVIATHDHGLDFLLAEEALLRGDAAYVGMIGSATKRARLAARLGGLAARLTCPIGGPAIPDKRPESIAALVAAELVRAFAHRDTPSPIGEQSSPDAVVWP